MASSALSALIGPAVAKIQSTHVEPKDDMLAERARSNLAVEQLSYLLNGGKESLEKRYGFHKCGASSGQCKTTTLYNRGSTNSPPCSPPQHAVKGLIVFDFYSVS